MMKKLCEHRNSLPQAFMPRLFYAHYLAPPSRRMVWWGVILAHGLLLWLLQLLQMHGSAPSQAGQAIVQLFRPQAGLVK